MPRQYPPHFRRDMMNRMLAGEKRHILGSRDLLAVADSLVEKQALVDPGVKDGLDSQGGAELREAKKLIKGLEMELQLAKDASDPFDLQVVVPLKDGRPLPKD